MTPVDSLEPAVETREEATACDPLPGYVALPGRHDELRSADGGVRPAWREFLGLLGPGPAGALRTAQDACAAAVADLDVTMNVYSGERAGVRSWPLDAVPLLVTADEWRRLEAGVGQRARLLNEVLRDLYGPGRLLDRGLLPAEMVSRNPHFLRPCAGLGAASAVLLHTCAVDVARAPDGGWVVLRHRLDSPSGLGYSLQNRILARQAFGRVFHRAPVERLYDFFGAFRGSLSALAPDGGSDPLVAFLTPGSAHETYYEQAYLARHLGYPLVEGSDLTTRDGAVFLRTVGGLKRIGTLVRRVDSAYCDPLELLPHSLLGVPGLVHAAQSGRVAIANQPGAGALEATALLPFIGALAREVLGEDLILPGVATWWCGREPGRERVLGALDNLLVKPAFRPAEGPERIEGPFPDEVRRADIADRIRADPAAFCGQEMVPLGTSPAWVDGRLAPVPFVLRLFVTWSEGGYRVMPGGLTRFQPAGGDALVTLRHGAATKDTWVLRPNGVDPAPLPPATGLADLVTRSSEVPSRLADNLFWLGRYLERAGQAAHLMVKLSPAARDEIAAVDPGVAESAAQLFLRLQGGRSGVLPAPDGDALRAAAADPDSPTSLIENVRRLVRALDEVKARLPSGAWRCLRQFRRQTRPEELDPDELTPAIAAMEAIVNESLARDTAWRFLSIGRHLERALHLTYLLGGLAPAGEAAGGWVRATEFRLQTLLHLADSLFSYRSQHPGGFQSESVLSWLVTARANPRSLRFLAAEIAACLALLPDRLSPRAVASLRVAAADLERRAAEADPTVLVHGRGSGFPDSLPAECGGALWDLSERITRIYFSHAGEAREPE